MALDERAEIAEECSAPRLALVDDDLFLEHRARGHHPERPERLLAARSAVAGQSLVAVGPRDATLEELGRIHSPRYLDALEKLRGTYGALDDDTFVGPRSVDAAYRAAGGSIALIDAILEEAGPRQGVALLRPPGHHAKPDGGMGFCLLNNVAIAAAHARSQGVRRVAIVDWDVHHGNGTQDAFFATPDVLFLSIHQSPFYPGTGLLREVGLDAGRGFNVNLPLSAHAGDPAYLEAFESIVVPTLELYEPELILISAGFDAHARDPLASMTVTGAGFGKMAELARKVADRTAEGRIALFLEGGYDLEGLEESLAASVDAILAPTRLRPDPRGVVAREHQAELAAARAKLSQFWKI